MNTATQQNWDNHVLCALLIGIHLFLAGCDEHRAWIEDPSWSPDGAGVVFVSPTDPAWLLVGPSSSLSWTTLGPAVDGTQFYHPLWLENERGHALIVALELPKGDKSTAPEGGVRAFDLDTGASMDSLAATITARLHELDDLDFLSASGGRRSVLFAGSVAGRRVLRELDIPTLAEREWVSSAATQWQCLASDDGHRIALWEPGVVDGSGKALGSRVTVLATPAIASRPLAIWDLAPSDVELLSWSPDGVWLAARRKDSVEGLLLFRPADGAIRPVAAAPIRGAAIWSQDSRQLAFLTRSSDDSATPSTLWVYDTIRGRIASTEVSASAQLVGWTQRSYEVFILESENGRTEVWLMDPEHTTRRLAMGEAAEAGLFVSPRQNLGVWIAKDGLPAWLFF